MANPGSAHNDLFLASFENVRDAAAELRSSLPKALAEQVQWETLKPVSGSFIDETVRWSHSDKLYEVRYGEQDALLYVLWEHKSEVDKWTLLQLLRYMVRIWEKCLAQKPAPSKLPPIIPVIIHHSETGWTATTSFQGLFDEALMADAVLRRMTPQFEAAIDDISHARDAELRSRGLSPKALLGIVFLRDGRSEGRILEELECWAEEFKELLASPDGVRAICQLFSYLMRVAQNLERSTLERRVRQVIPETEELVMTLAEQLIQQGRAEGITQGLSRQRKLVRRQMELKFGSLTADALVRLESADECALERYAERVITATSLAEVLSD
ncbi:MAG: Rpn family recombination-promoting nuclease/putative transposase [Myxococcales bacterium]